jgi:putative salt-induced outer membrane protein
MLHERLEPTYGRAIAVACAIGAFLASPRQANAQDLPKGTSDANAPVSKGTTDVTSDGFQAAAHRDPDAKDATELSLSGGGLSSSGNSRLVATTANGQTRIRREDNQFSAIVAANYTRTALPGTDLQTTVENYQGKARYDRFFLDNWTAFLGVQGRRDRFQGLALRMQVDPGVGYYFINEAAHLLWVEVGYDLLYDIRRDDSLDVFDDKGLLIEHLPKTKTVHSGRLFLGYTNKLNDAVTFQGGVEFLQALTDSHIRRVNGDMSLSSKLAGKFSAATSFQIRYDNDPLPGKEKVDTATSLNLVYTVL